MRRLALLLALAALAAPAAASANGTSTVRMFRCVLQGGHVTAPAGKVLYFMCEIHPWMQGKIIVH